MTPEQVEELGPAFADYLQQFLFCCDSTPTFHLLGVYGRGRLSDLPRKTCAPIALASGTAVRTLQEFRKDHAWSYRLARDPLQEHVAALLPTLAGDDRGTGGVSDETGVAKKGTQTPGVQRPWCGELGKKENGLLTVHLAVAKGRYKTRVDAELFLPESWDQDRDRCRAAGIPDTVSYRPTWPIALRQLDRAGANGLRCDWLTFEEDYGRKPGFLEGRDARPRRFVGAVPRSCVSFVRRPRRGERGPRADHLARHSPAFTPQCWQRFALPRETLGDQEWQAKAARIWLSCAGVPSAPPDWLIWARPVRTGEAKYFVSNAPEGTPLDVLLRVGFRRWPVEHALRLAPSELGLRHCEGRNDGALLRHLTLCLVTWTFGAGQAEGLRGDKSRGDRGAGGPRAEWGVCPLAGGVAGAEPSGARVGGPRLSPAA